MNILDELGIPGTDEHDELHGLTLPDDVNTAYASGRPAQTPTSLAPTRLNAGAGTSMQELQALARQKGAPASKVDKVLAGLSTPSTNPMNRGSAILSGLVNGLTGARAAGKPDVKSRFEMLAKLYGLEQKDRMDGLTLADRQARTAAYVANAGRTGAGRQLHPAVIGKYIRDELNDLFPSVTDKNRGAYDAKRKELEELYGFPGLPRGANGVTSQPAPVVVPGPGAPKPTTPAPAPQPKPTAKPGLNELLPGAKEALKRGAPRDAVQKRIEENIGRPLTRTEINGLTAS